jgi:arylsulfatase
MTKGPNILLITADQLQRKSLSVYGNRAIKTPNIQGLANTGTTMDYHYIQNPVCSPSRATMFTGKYPRNHGLRENGCTMYDGLESIASALKDNGYITGAFGKMHFTPQMTAYREDDNWPEDDFGFLVKHLTCDHRRGEYMDWLYENYADWYEYMTKPQNRKPVECNGKLWTDAPQMLENLLPAELHQTTWIANHTIEFIKKERTEPFFAWCSFVDPHHPFDPPEPYASMYNYEDIELPIRREGEMEDKPEHFRAILTGKGPGNEKYKFDTMSDDVYKMIICKYYGMISLIDDNIGRIIKALKESGQYDNTVIIFTSDHGEYLGDHRLLFKGPFHYDSLIRVPMVINYPSYIPAGSHCKAITQHTDIMPTILQLAGVSVPAGVQGRSMIPAIMGDIGSGYDFALTENFNGDWGMNIKTISSREWKLTYYCGMEFGELYHLRNDPEEFVNLWDNPDFEKIKINLIKKLLDRLIATENTLPLRQCKW